MIGKVVIVAILALAVYIAVSMKDDFEPEKLKGKRVLVTGTSAGIGEQLAYNYAKFGANIVITARREHRLKEVIQKCRKLGVKDGQYDYITADMSNLHDADNVIQETVQKLGGLDVLVLNHAQYFFKPFRGTPENLTLFDKVFDVNFKSYVYLTSFAIPHLQKSKGYVIAVSSIVGTLASPFNSIYSSSKFAISGFFKALQQEFMIENTGVSATICTLGMIDTEHAIEEVESFGMGSFTKNIPKATPPDTARAIIKSGESRDSEMFYPYFWKWFVRFIQMFPDLMEWRQVKTFKELRAGEL